MKLTNSATLAKLVLTVALASMNAHASATDRQQTGLTLSKIRAVGDYQGTLFDNTIELWFTTALVWPAGSACTSTIRVIIDAKNKHLVAVAYLALSTGRKVDISLDETLPIRDGACEVSFLDLPA